MSAIKNNTTGDVIIDTKNLDMPPNYSNNNGPTKIKLVQTINPVIQLDNLDVALYIPLDSGLVTINYENYTVIITNEQNNKYSILHRTVGEEDVLIQNKETGYSGSYKGIFYVIGSALIWFKSGNAFVPSSQIIKDDLTIKRVLDFVEKVNTVI